MRTSRQQPADRRKNLSRQAVRQAAQSSIEGLESRLMFDGSTPSMTSLTISPNPYDTSSGTGVTLAAAVTPLAGSGVPTGEVDFYNGTSLVGSGTLSGGALIVNVTTLPPGSDTITADYLGDATYTHSSSTPQVEQVNGAGSTTVNTTTTVTSDSPGGSAAAGATVTFTSTVTPATTGGPAVTGTVTFFDGSTSIGTGTVSGSGTATFATSTLGVGSHSITATYGGDGGANYNASNSGPFTETITGSSGTAADTVTVNNTGSSSFTFGTPATFTVNVSPTSGAGSVPTGTVQLLSNGTVVASMNLANAPGSPTPTGTASFSVSTLPVGSDTITAAYSGDSNYVASTSATGATVTVSPSALTPTTTSVSLGLGSSSSIMVGDSVTFTATVSPSSAGGSVNFFSDGTFFGSGTLTGGFASVTTSVLPAGSHNITAMYNGDSNDAPSTSAPIVETVSAGTAMTTTTVTYAPVAPTVGNVVTLTAMVTPGTAGGTIEFFDGGSSLGTVPLVGGMASIDAPSFVAGSHTITATYSGDAADSASTSSPVSVSVAQGTPAMTTSTSAPTINLGDTTTFTATVGPQVTGGIIPTGNVTFMDGMTAISGLIPLTNGVATIDDSSLTVGSHSISFMYAGDTNYIATSAPAVIQTVNPGLTTTVLTTSPNPSVFNTGVVLTATVAPILPTGVPTGTVTFFDGTTQLATPVMLINGVASTPVFTLPTGSNSITAVYNADPNYATSTSSTVIQTVTRSSTGTLLSASPTSIVYGGATVLTATVLAPSPTGDVSFFLGGNLIGTTTLTGNTATLMVPDLAVGANGLTATYNGDTNFAPSTSTAAVVTVTQATSFVIVDPNPSVVAVGAPVTVTVTVGFNTGIATPTGTVTLVEDGTTILATGLALVNGTATFTTTTLGLGVDTIAAIYSGDANYIGSTSATASVGVSAVTASTSTTTLTSTNTTPTYGDPVTFTAVVAPALSSALTPTGTVTFFDGNVALGAPVSVVAGVAVFTTSSIIPGTSSITAVYNGDANFTPSTSAPVTEVVAGSANTGLYVTTLNVSSFNAAFGDPVTLTASVFPSLLGTPPPFGGTVTFFAGSQTLGAATLGADDTVTFSTPLPAGTNEITAAYNGGGPITASLPRMVAVSSPATPSLSRAKLPPALVAGHGLHTVLPVVVTNLSDATLKGMYTIQVYLDSSKTLDGNRVLLTTLSRNLSLRGNKSHTFVIPENVSSSVSPGTYYFLADVTDPNGLTNIVASKPIVVAQPFVGLSATVSATNPPMIELGKSASVWVTITNTGNEVATGTLSLTLSASSDGINAISGKTLGTGSITATILPGKSRKFRVTLDSTPLAVGSYFPYISAALDGATTTAVGLTPFTVG